MYTFLYVVHTAACTIVRTKILTNCAHLRNVTVVLVTEFRLQVLQHTFTRRRGSEFRYLTLAETWQLENWRNKKVGAPWVQFKKKLKFPVCTQRSSCSIVP